MKIFAIISIYFILSESCYFRNVEVEGDFYLATFLAFHTDEYCTGPISEAIAYQYEALLWAVERLNNHSFFGKEKLGLKVFDTCFSKFHTSKHLIDDILEHDTSKINYISSLYNCSDTKDNVVGILGPTTSAISETISTFFKKTNTEMATFGISATSTRLSNEQVFPNFFRVVPPDIIQTQSLVTLMENSGWNFILTMGTDDSYGTEGLKELHALLKEKKICYIECPRIKTSRIHWYEWGQKFENEIFEKINFKSIGIVFYGQPETFKSAVETLGGILRNKLVNITWIVTESYTEEIKDMSRNHELANFTVVNLELSNTLGLKEVNRYLQEKSGDTIMNPWWAECQQKKTQGNCLLKQFQKFPPKYTTAALDALYFYAQAIKNGLNQSKCETYRQCSELRSHVIKFLKGAQLDYNGQQWSEVVPEEYKNRNKTLLDENGDLILEFKNELLTIKSFRLNEKDGEGALVGYISKERLILKNEKSTETTFGKSQCPVSTKCTEYCEDITKLKYAYVKANKTTEKKNKFIIIAILPISENSDRADEIVNLKCSDDLRDLSAGYELFEAFKYAIEKYSTDVDGIVFDDCYNPLRPAKIFTDLLSGTLVATNIKGERVEVNNDDVIAIIGTESSDVTRNIAPFAEQMKVVQISFGATAVVFDNKKLFPNFLRTVPSDSAQAEAMVKVAVKLNWKCACIIHTTNLYGNGGADKLEEYAKKYGIFISFKRNFTSQNAKKNSDEENKEYTQIISKLEDDNSPKQIFYFGDNKPVTRLLKRLHDSRFRKTYLFIASESWGDSTTVVKDSEATAQNAIIVKINSPTGSDLNEQFDKYLDKRTLKYHKHVNNPWYNKYYQMANKCHLQESWQKSNHEKECDGVKRLKLDRSGRQFCYHVLTSVIAVIKAVELIKLRHYTESRYKEEKPFLKVFKQVKLKENSDATIFNEDGNGKSLYSFYYFTTDVNGSNVYKQINNLADFDIIINKSYKVVNQCEDPPPPSRNLLLLIIIVMSCAMGVIIIIACSFGIYKIVSFISRTRGPRETIRNQTNLEIHNWINQTNGMTRPNPRLRGDDDSIAFESVVHSVPGDMRVSYI
ncbi:DgyrCDS2493 [Dimorphilus gyrociliatus]|uniref:DgyrCDS2493 n=1 Tax=Dimorphilus gyrociliatus TaxID=2664684 RepID=A0A7I8VD86_9ANNE|nr:DgyrCDS2493 [Dimorphilus gyrociliatus]